MVDKIGVGLAYGSGQLAPPPSNIPTAPVVARPPTDKGVADDAADFLEQHFRQRMEIIENQFKAGLVSLETYQASLDELMAHEVPWTSAWVALQEKKADASKYWADKVKEYLDTINKHNMMIEDNMFAVEKLGKDRYLEILQERLRGLEEYSAEWTAIWQKIQQISGDAREAEMELIRTYQAGREFGERFGELANQRMLTAAPTTSSTVTYNTRNFSPTLNAYGSDAMQASTTNNQKLRDLAAVY